MSDIAIQVENLGKRYRIGECKETYGTLRDTLMQAMQAPLRAWRGRGSRNGRAEIWALQDVSFDVKRDEVLGIIGRNGAGKSTLLKVLSRVTRPTVGRAWIHGRVGSLLEVGTGFHPELTGRENIYLNGAILGMTKTEIDRKFDEIVEFAEIARFLETPVKRYSSGMYMRLAFSIAAHLEPEILIVDEVLAVGDVAFQKKCLGKMQDISTSQGRTILFVSHNMAAIQRLCSRCVMLEHGQLIAEGNSASIIARYLSINSYEARPNEWIDVSYVERTGTGEARFTAIQYSSLNPSTALQPYSDGPIEFQLMIESDSVRSIGSLAVVFYDQSGTKLVNADTVLLGQILSLRQGRKTVKLRIEKLYLNPGVYTLGLWLADPLNFKMTGTYFDYITSAFQIEVVDPGSKGLGERPKSDGVVTCSFELVEVA
jgi:lipopolysaccharide transport system ATP-binding protein